MLKEIGSNFWLTPIKKEKTRINTSIFNTDFDDIVLMSSGRNAISQVLQDITINKMIALLPSFTCESVIEPFIKFGFKVYFYQIDKTATIDCDSFKESCLKWQPSVVLIHSYYGFDTSSSIKEFLDEIKKQGTVIIEDITQTLYSNFLRLPSDYIIGSFRKWAGIPDGGFALKRIGSFITHPNKNDEATTRAKIDAMQCKYDYMVLNKGDKETFLKKYADAEELLEEQNDLYKMSMLSILEQANLDIPFLKANRRNNFDCLLKKINNPNITPLFNNLPTNVTPLYFPVFCSKKRTTFQKFLRDNNIYAPIVWPQSKYVSNASKDVVFLYENLLCIPCDQRYTIEEMEYVSRIINEWRP